MRRAGDDGVAVVRRPVGKLRRKLAHDLGIVGEAQHQCREPAFSARAVDASTIVEASPQAFDCPTDGARATLNAPTIGRRRCANIKRGASAGPLLRPIERRGHCASRCSIAAWGSICAAGGLG